MRILFVTSGVRRNSPSPIIKAQAESLEKYGHELNFFLIQSAGITGYLSAVYQLRGFLKANTGFDIIHAHYALSGIFSALAGAKPLVVSMMGSDLVFNKLLSIVIRIFAKYYWNVSIVKSRQMKFLSRIRHAQIIPNGVDLDLFTPVNADEARKKLGWDPDKKHLLFASDPGRSEKNFNLFVAATHLLESFDINIHVLNHIPHQSIPLYLNAANVIVLSSFREGSPNVIKEAMACNRPIVSTDVGDVRWLFGDTKGCYISSFDPKEFADALKKAIDFSNTTGFTKGRERILQIGLSSENVAQKLINIYQSCLMNA